MRASIALLPVTAACVGLSPLRGRAVVGRDAYVIFVGDGPGGQSDLFGVRADGGPVFQITFTNVAEAAPALSPDGATVAFLRARSPGDSVPDALWVLSLVTGAERELPLPAETRAERLGWSRDGAVIYVSGGAARYAVHAPPAAPAPRVLEGPERTLADSGVAVLLGDPVFGRAVACGQALCVQADTGAPSPFAEDAHDAARWGSDSVGFFSAGRLIVRPLGPGRARRVEWSDAPGRPRQMTVFAGR